MHELLWLFMALLSPSGGLGAQKDACPIIGQKPGIYSGLGTILCFQDVDSERRHLEIPSPDHAILLVVDGTTGKITENGQQVGSPFDIGIEETDIIWSPDSRAMITTMSLGGLGPVSADVSYFRNHLHSDAPSITHIIQKDFAMRHPDSPCTTNVNVGGLTWEGVDKAVFVAEVPSSSSCGKMIGYFEAYVLSIPDGRILARYSHRQTIERWRSVLSPQMLDDR